MVSSIQDNLDIFRKADSLQRMLDILRKDPVQHISVINFVEDNAVKNVLQIGSSWIIRGRSDRDWVYLVCRNRREFSALKSHLREEDRCFGAIVDWIVQELTLGHEVKWNLSLTRYILPENCVSPDPIHATRQLTPEDAKTVYENSDYRDFISADYVCQRIQRGPGRGIECNGRLIAWGLTQDDGAMGFLHVLPAFRKRGYGRSISLALIQDIRLSGRLPFAYIEPDNEKSIGLVSELGFVKQGNYQWFELSCPQDIDAD